MASYFQIVFGVTSILASVAALYVLIIATFQTKQPVGQPKSGVVRRPVRTITASEIRKKISQLKRKTNTRITSMLWTVLIGQSMGIYFLTNFVGKTWSVRIIIKMNGGFLLLASILCSIMTILNGWLKKRTIVSFRLIFQAYSFATAVLLLMTRYSRGGIGQRVDLFVGLMPQVVTYFYIATVVIALGLMLWDALYRKHLHVEYDYSIYYRLVVLIGMFLGLGMIMGMKYRGGF
jgi:hypothetical protein